MLTDKDMIELIAVLSDLAADVTSALDEEALASAIQRSLDRLVEVRFSALFVFDPDLQRLRLLYARGASEEARREAESTAMERDPGRVFLSRKRIHVPDVEAERDPQALADHTLGGAGSVLHSPVIFGEECVGVISLASPIPNAFSERHLAVLDFLGSMVGVVHANLQHIRSITSHIELVRRQRAELRELSAPILMIGRGALLLPVIGRVDADRAAHMQEKLLNAIAERRARAVILDLTGMDAAGSQALDALLQIANASRRMGARCVLSGLTSRAAMAMADLPAPLRSGDIFGTVEAALASVLRPSISPSRVAQ